MKLLDHSGNHLYQDHLCLAPNRDLKTQNRKVNGINLDRVQTTTLDEKLPRWLTARPEVLSRLPGRASD